jgi:hypothetical protein
MFAEIEEKRNDVLLRYGSSGAESFLVGLTGVAERGGEQGAGRLGEISKPRAHLNDP